MPRLRPELGLVLRLLEMRNSNHRPITDLLDTARRQIRTSGSCAVLLSGRLANPKPARSVLDALARDPVRLIAPVSKPVAFWNTNPR